MKKTLSLVLIAFLALHTSTFAQSRKIKPSGNTNPGPPAEMRLKWPGKAAVPVVENPFGLPSVRMKPLPPLPANRPASENVRIVQGENGLPIFFSGQTAASVSSAEYKTPAMRAVEYFASLNPAGIRKPAAEFAVKTVQEDEQGNLHVRMEQTFQGIPVYGGEVIAHADNGIFQTLNGRYFPTPLLKDVKASVNAEQAIEVVKIRIGANKIKTAWSTLDLKMIGNKRQFEAELVVYHTNGALDGEKLAWVITARPNLMTRTVYFVEAKTGEIIHTFDHTCRIAGNHQHDAEGDCTGSDDPIKPANFTVDAPLVANGPVTANGLDLLNQNRSFGAWMDVSGAIVLEDASKPMFNSAASDMPTDPVGAIITYDAKNTSPEKQATFDYNFVISSTSTFSNKSAVSTHYNSIKSYDYFRTKFNRNSIDGAGGNVAAFFNVTESDGSSMDNAFWNGEAMWYGNGGSFFKPLARGLDVGGHELTHGVVEKTANLEYQGESGALNESFADVFGVMIDNDDWKIGEDVVQPGVSPNGCLRDMQNPNNGAPINSQWWQPRNMSERYTGTEDNGGVHINSGIPNYAFYLFASNPAVGKDKAEQVYYKALRDYLVKSSKFIDCRLAIIKAATDLYGGNVANVAAAAFEAVGIGGTQAGGNYLGTLAVNPGTDYALCAPANYSRLDLANGSGTVLGAVYNQKIKSRPSVRDNGTEFVFVNDNGDIIGGTLVYSGGNITPQTDILSDQPVWRSAAMSKDGRYVAAVRETIENIIFVFDLASGLSRAYTLYNPTYSQNGNKTGEVHYADVLEFDYSGENLMYDAYNESINSVGDTISYWDIGFLQYRDKGQFVQPKDLFISKLFSGLPEKTSIGNPTFAKNSPFIIAFDLIDGIKDPSDPQYDILGANTETGDFDALLENNGDLGWPNYNRLDNAVIYEGLSDDNNYNIYKRNVDASKIKGSGLEAQFIANRLWGVWFANGTRSFQVTDAKEPGAQLSGLSVSPNPTAHIATVQFDAPTAAATRCTLVNLMGQTLLTRTFDAAEGINTFGVDLEDMPSGTYLVRVETGKASGVVRVVKQ